MQGGGSSAQETNTLNDIKPEHKGGYVSINPEVRVITIDTSAPPMSNGGKKNIEYAEIMDPYEGK